MSVVTPSPTSVEAPIILIADDPAAAKSTEDCVGKYEYMPEGSWKGSGTCAWAFKGGDKIYETWEEGPHLKEYVVQVYRWHRQIRGPQRRRNVYERDTLTAGRYKSRIELH